MLERPTHLPAARRRIVRLLELVEADPPEGLRDAAAQGRMLAARVRACDLYWVTSQMAAVALDASVDIPPDLTVHPPSEHGLLVVEAGALPSLKGRAPRAISWHFAGLGLSVALWSEPSAEAREMIAARWGISLSEVADLLYDPDGLIEVEDQAGVDLDDPGLPATHRATLALLSSMWVMMETPTVAEQSQWTERRSRAGARRRPPATVTTISLRRMRRVATASDGDSGRVYTHQWVVRGHWREQAHGPGRAQRRTTWVPSYVKGPAGAPLLVREHVRVWRR